MKKILCVLESSHQENTKKIIDALQKVCPIDVVNSSEAMKINLRSYDLVGFASGIYYNKHAKQIIALVKSLPILPVDAFIISTAGSKSIRRNHRALRKILLQKGVNIVGEFSCRGLDKFGPFKLLGGINKSRPNESDLKNAQDFMKKLLFSNEPNKWQDVKLSR